MKPLFWILTVGGQLGGQLGPVFLLAPLALLTLRTSVGRRLLLAGLIITLPYPQNIGARFLIPVLPFVAMGIALSLEFSRALQAVVVLTAGLAGMAEDHRQVSGTRRRLADRDDALAGGAGHRAARQVADAACKWMGYCKNARSVRASGQASLEHVARGRSLRKNRSPRKLLLG